MLTRRRRVAVNHLWTLINARDLVFEAERRRSASRDAGADFGQPTQQSLEGVFAEARWPPGATFVDLGSGTGTVLFHVLTTGLARRAVGVDFSQSLVNEASLRAALFERQGLPVIAAENRFGNILDITVAELRALAGREHLVLFAFDARFPVAVVNHIGALVRDYQGALTFVTSHSSYRYRSISLVLRQLRNPLRIGASGVTESTQPEPLRVRGDQSDNYPESDWMRIEEEDLDAELANARRLAESIVLIEQLEEFVVYAMQRGDRKRESNSFV